MSIWRNENGIEYFVCLKEKILFQIPSFIGKILYKENT